MSNSLAYVVGRGIHSDSLFHVENCSKSGAGILAQNCANTRRNNQITLTDFTNKSNVVVQLSGNDFFSHLTTTDPYTNLRHFTKLNIMKGSNDRKAFCKIIDSFFKNFEGQLVVVVGMFPRYININCCSYHRATQTEQNDIHNLVKLVNIGLSKMCNFHTKTGTAKFIFLHPESILQSAGLTQEKSLHCDLSLIHI